MRFNKTHPSFYNGNLYYYNALLIIGLIIMHTTTYFFMTSVYLSWLQMWWEVTAHCKQVRVMMWSYRKRTVAYVIMLHNMVECTEALYFGEVVIGREDFKRTLVHHRTGKYWSFTILLWRKGEGGGGYYWQAISRKHDYDYI